MTRAPIPAYGPGKKLQRLAELAAWYELHLKQIATEYPNNNDHPGRIARKALAEREHILSDGHYS